MPKRLKPRSSFRRRAPGAEFRTIRVEVIKSAASALTRAAGHLWRPYCDCAGIDRIAREHLLEVDRKLVDLTALRKELKAVIDSCDGDIVADCRIIEASGPVPPA